MTQKAEIAAVEAAKSAAARGASPEEQAGTNDAKPQSWSVGFQPTRQWFAEDWECVPAKVFKHLYAFDPSSQETSEKAVVWVDVITSYSDGKGIHT